MANQASEDDDLGCNFNLNIDSGELENILNDGSGLVKEVIGIESTSNSTMDFTNSMSAQVVTSSPPRRTNLAEPYVEIIEQPQGRGLRFRYECEGRTAGSIIGENSTVDKKTFPTIRIHNHDADSVVVVSCVTKEDPVRAHPHSLVGRDCQKGVCTVKLKKHTKSAEFQGLGIQCAKKKEIEDALKKREEIRVDPFGNGFGHKKNINLVNMAAVRLCFQVFLPDRSGRYTRVLTPVVSQAIYDKKSKGDLTICRVDKHAGSVKGGDEVFLLCDKVNSKDIEVRFFEENDIDGLVWEDYGSFGQGDVHRQFAIVFKTPGYRDMTIKNPANVMMQLKRPSDGETSDPKPFIYIPLDEDPEGIEGKRKRKKICLDNFMQVEPIPSTSEGGIKSTTCEKLFEKISAKKRCTKIKQENPGSPMNVNTWSPNLPETGAIANPTTSAGQWQSYNAVTLPVTTNAVAASTIDTSALAEISSVTGPPNDYIQSIFALSKSTEPANAQDLLGTLSEGGSNFTIDSNLFAQQVNTNTPIYLNETVEGLSGDLATVDYDPNIAAHENVISMDEVEVGGIHLKSDDIRDLLRDFGEEMN